MIFSVLHTKKRKGRKGEKSEGKEKRKKKKKEGPGDGDQAEMGQIVGWGVEEG